MEDRVVEVVQAETVVAQRADVPVATAVAGLMAVDALVGHAERITLTEQLPQEMAQHLMEQPLAEPRLPDLLLPPQLQDRGP